MVTPIPEEIIWHYGKWQPSYGNAYGVKFVEGLPVKEEAEGRRRKRCLIIIDDLMHETDERVTRLFTKGSHHSNTSVMYIVQNLFGKNKEHRTISLNAQYLVVFKNPRDASQITQLAKQMYPGRVTYLQEAFKDATTAPHGYLVLDVHQTTPEHLRLRADIFSDRQVVYIPK